VTSLINNSAELLFQLFSEIHSHHYWQRVDAPCVIDSAESELIYITVENAKYNC
jgi:hypothetical protein